MRVKAPSRNVFATQTNDHIEDERAGSLHRRQCIARVSGGLRNGFIWLVSVPIPVVRKRAFYVLLKALRQRRESSITFPDWLVVLKQLGASLVQGVELAAEVAIGEGIQTGTQLRAGGECEQEALVFACPL